MDDILKRFEEREPTNLFRLKSRKLRVRFPLPMFVGNEPPKEFHFKFKKVSIVIDPIDDGIVPER